MSIGPMGPGGPGQWDDLFARFFGAAEPRRAAQRIDITKYMSNDAREVLSDAARRAAELADPASRSPTSTPTTCSGRCCSRSR